MTTEINTSKKERKKMKFTHLESSRDKILNIISPPSNCYPTELRLYKSFPIVY